VRDSRIAHVNGHRPPHVQTLQFVAYESAPENAASHLNLFGDIRGFRWIQVKAQVVHHPERVPSVQPGFGCLAAGIVRRSQQKQAYYGWNGRSCEKAALGKQVVAAFKEALPGS
jgi:hypothetical protein